MLTIAKLKRWSISYYIDTARAEPSVDAAAAVVDRRNRRSQVRPMRHENGPRSDLRGPFQLVEGTGFEPATSGL